MFRVFKKKKETPKSNSRSFNGAKMGRLTAGWSTSITTSDEELRRSLKILRARSRELAQNNDYVERFLEFSKTNIVGNNGIKLQARIIAKEENGKKIYDKVANDKIESAWEEWGKTENCCVDGTLSWIDVQDLVIESVFRDGEVLVRKIKGKNSQNKFYFALQILEADHLDEEFHKMLPDGNYIKMGIEFNEWNRPVAYHLFRKHPGEYSYYGQSGANDRIRVPAEEIIHLFKPKRASQSRGYPKLSTAMTRLNMLGGYEEAELTAARVSACKMGFYVKEDGTISEDPEGEVDADGSLITEAEPGIFETLPAGTKFESWDPQHPNSSFGSFVKSMKQSIASGVGMIYPALAGDLEGVNYSSIRQGNLWDRDTWRRWQTWLIEHLHQKIYEEFLLMAMTSEKIGLPIIKIKKFNKVYWQPRGWQWVDPLKEVTANALAIEKGLKTAQDVAAEQGKDIEEVYAQLAAERGLRDQYGVKVAEEGIKVILNTEDEEENVKTSKKGKRKFSS